MVNSIVQLLFTVFLLRYQNLPKRIYSRIELQPMLLIHKRRVNFNKILGQFHVRQKTYCMPPYAFCHSL